VTLPADVINLAATTVPVVRSVHKVLKYIEHQSVCPLVGIGTPPPRVSFETSFDSKQPKLEPKLVSALSETKRLFRLFRFYTETESFGVSIERKQTEVPPKSLKV
jgi:hypothetical protein